jgi:hypothetical protein
MQLSTKNSSENHTQCTRGSASALTFQHATDEEAAFASVQPKSQSATSLALYLSWQLQLLSF